MENGEPTVMEVLFGLFTDVIVCFQIYSLDQDMVTDMDTQETTGTTTIETIEIQSLIMEPLVNTVLHLPQTQKLVGLVNPKHLETE